MAPRSDLCALLSCNKNVTKTQASVGCSICGKWFHAACADVSTEQLGLLKKHKNFGFTCSTCASNPTKCDSSLLDQIRQGQADVQLKFDSILAEVRNELSTQPGDVR